MPHPLIPSAQTVEQEETIKINNNNNKKTEKNKFPANLILLSWPTYIEPRVKRGRHKDKTKSNPLTNQKVTSICG